MQLRFEIEYTLCPKPLTCVPLYGALGWVAANPAPISAPVWPPPPGLWSPGYYPSSQNYLYIQNGQIIFYNDYTENLVFSYANSTLGLEMGAGTWPSAYFQAMNSRGRLEPGYYGVVGKYPGYNPSLATMIWDIESGISSAEWFVVDSAVYDSSGNLTAI